MGTEALVNKLESLQFDILLWKRREQSDYAKEKLSRYDEFLEDIIDSLLETE